MVEDEFSANIKDSMSRALRQRCFGKDKADHPEVSHAFADATHNCCCALGPKARKYADMSGNPIGTASEKLGAKGPGEDTFKWSTCMGSAVCSNYAQRFKDGTRIVFASDPKHRLIYEPDQKEPPISQVCESWLQNVPFSSVSHGTPGIETAQGACSAKDSKAISSRIRPLNNPNSI